MDVREFLEYYVYYVCLLTVSKTYAFLHNLLFEDSLDLNTALKLYSKYSKSCDGETYIEWVVNNNDIRDLDAFIGGHPKSKLSELAPTLCHVTSFHEMVSTRPSFGF